MRDSSKAYLLGALSVVLAFVLIVIWSVMGIGAAREQTRLKHETRQTCIAVTQDIDGCTEASEGF